eukprot:6295176-Prymnesium_polylepis.1
MSYGDTATRHCTHDDAITRLTSKKRPSNQLTRLSACDVSEAYRPEGHPLSTSRPGGGRYCLEMRRRSFTKCEHR